MNVEDELRIVLVERAAEPAPRRDLLPLVDARVRRVRRRRTVLAAGGAALALAAVVTVPVLLPAHGEDPAPPSATPSLEWAAPRWPAPAFPLRPGWLPDGTGKPQVIQAGSNVRLTYERGDHVLSAEVGPVPPTWESEGDEDHAGTVNRQPATIRTGSTYDGAKEGDRYVGIRWRLADGGWAQVLSFGRLTEAQVLRFAENLRPGSIVAGRAPFRFATVPPGLTLQYQGVDTMCLAPAAEAPAKSDEERRQPAGLCLMVIDESFDDAGLTSIVPVGDRRGGWAGNNLHVDLGADRVLEFSWDRDQIPLTAADVIRFAAGVTVTAS